MTIKKLYVVDVPGKGELAICLTKKEAMELVKKHRVMYGKNDVVLMVFERVV